MAESSTTTTTATHLPSTTAHLTTTHAPTKCPLPVGCICVTSDWLSINERFTIETNEGLDLALISSMILALYILLNIMMYNWRTPCRDRNTIQITVTKYQKILNGIYMLFLICFEIVWIYGHQFTQQNPSSPDNKYALPRPLVFILIFWVVSNTLACSILLIGFFTKEMFRFAMYISVSIHAPVFLAMMIDRLVFREINVDIMIPLILFILDIFQLLNVPSIYLLTREKLEMERQSLQNRKKTEYIVVESQPQPFISLSAFTEQLPTMIDKNNNNNNNSNDNSLRIDKKQ